MTTPRLIPTAGLALNTRVQGEGLPLLFLGGSNFDLAVRAPVFDSALTQRFTIAAADPRGLGNSDIPNGDWSMSHYARDAIDLMDALEWPAAYVLGESFGAMVAMELAILAPHRIVKLGLAAGAPGGQGGSSYPIHELLSISEARKRVIKSLSIQDARFTALMDEDAKAAEDRIALRMENDAKFLQHSHNAEGYPRLLATRAQHDCWDRLAAVSTETLVIAGRFDLQAPLDRSEAMHKRMPAAELSVFDSGHNVLFATPEPVNLMISRWCC